MEGDSGLEMEAYVMPNAPISDDTPLNVFQVCSTKYLSFCKAQEADKSIKNLSYEKVLLKFEDSL